MLIWVSGYFNKYLINNLSVVLYYVLLVLAIVRNRSDGSLYSYILALCRAVAVEMHSNLPLRLGTCPLPQIQEESW